MAAVGASLPKPIFLTWGRGQRRSDRTIEGSPIGKLPRPQGTIPRGKRGKVDVPSLSTRRPRFAKRQQRSRMQRHGHKKGPQNSLLVAASFGELLETVCFTRGKGKRIGRARPSGQGGMLTNSTSPNTNFHIPPICTTPADPSSRTGQLLCPATGGPRPWLKVLPKARMIRLKPRPSPVSSIHAELKQC